MTEQHDERDPDGGGRLIPFRARAASDGDWWHGDAPPGTPAGTSRTETASPATMPHGGRAGEMVGPVVHGDVVEGMPDDLPTVPQDDGTTATVPTVAVDTPDEPLDWLSTLAARREAMPPIIPPSLATREEAARAARFVAGYYAHVGAFHATHSPLYLLTLMSHVPRGAGRAAAAWAAWASDSESLVLRQHAAARGDHSAYLVLKRQHQKTTRPRKAVSAVAVVGAFVAAVTVLPGAPAWVVAACAMAVLGALGLAGGHPDAPIIGRAVMPAGMVKLDSDTVLRALGALGIAAVNKALAAKGSEGIAFVAPIVMDGPGWRAEVDLPYGVTAVDVIERREALASGLRRPLGCVWPEPVSDEHTGRLVLWVGRVAMNKQPPVRWPLATTGSADLFKPVPFGADVRGRPVDIMLMFESVLIGSKPRMGKTFALRVLLLAAALDVLAELRVFELKGTGDCAALAEVAYDYGSGADEATLGRCMNTLRVAKRELLTRAETITRIAAKDPARCPENKVTPELVADRRLGLHPMVIAIDECQELYTHDEYKDEAAALSEALIKRGPAMGIILILATQRPDAKSLPTGVSANVGVRFCLRVMGQTENDMVLGTSSYKNGLRATSFTAKDKGIGYLVGALSDDPQITRTAYIDGPMAKDIAARARAMRTAAGTLSGYAAGDAPEVEDTSTLLDHLVEVWPGDAEAVWSVRLVDALAAYRPGLYGAWAEVADEKAKATQLATALRPFKVVTKQIKVDGRNLRGVVREDLDAAIGR